MEKLMTSEEVAEILHVDPVTIRRLVNRGDLSAYRIGADYRIAPSDLTRYLQRQRVEANAEVGDPSKLFEQFMNWLRQKSFTISPATVRDRFDRLTAPARQVLLLASEEARALQHNYIGTEHLLLGLLRQGEDTAAQVLVHMGIEIEKVRAAVVHMTGKGKHPVLGEVGLTPRSKSVIELAVDEARHMQHHYLGTEHLLLGLIRESDGVAAQILVSTGLKLGQIREEILATLQKRQPQANEENEEVEKVSQTLTPTAEEAATRAIKQEADDVAGASDKVSPLRPVQDAPAEEH